MNKGIKLAKGDVVEILNSDNILSNDHVIDWVYCKVLLKKSRYTSFGWQYNPSEQSVESSQRALSTHCNSGRGLVLVNPPVVASAVHKADSRKIR